MAERTRDYARDTTLAHGGQGMSALDHHYADIPEADLEGDRSKALAFRLNDILTTKDPATAEQLRADYPGNDSPWLHEPTGDSRKNNARRNTGGAATEAIIHASRDAVEHGNNDDAATVAQAVAHQMTAPVRNMIGSLEQTSTEGAGTFHPESMTQIAGQLTDRLQARADLLQDRLALHLYEAAAPEMLDRHAGEQASLHVPVPGTRTARNERRVLEGQETIGYYQDRAALEAAKTADQLRVLALDIRHMSEHAVFTENTSVGYVFESEALTDRHNAMKQELTAAVEAQFPKEQNPNLYLSNGNFHPDLIPQTKEGHELFRELVKDHAYGDAERLADDIAFNYARRSLENADIEGMDRMINEAHRHVNVKESLLRDKGPEPYRPYP